MPVGSPEISALNRVWLEPAGSTLRRTSMGKLPSTDRMVIERPGSYAMTSNRLSSVLPRNRALCSYVEPTPIGGGEVHSHDCCPFCHLGLFDESEMKANTSAEGRSISRSADNRTGSAHHGQKDRLEPGFIA